MAFFYVIEALTQVCHGIPSQRSDGIGDIKFYRTLVVFEMYLRMLAQMRILRVTCSLVTDLG